MIRVVRLLALLVSAVCTLTIAQTADQPEPNTSSPSVITHDDINHNHQITSDLTTAQIVKNVKLSNLRLGFVNFRRIMGTIPQLDTIRQSLDAEFKEQQNALLQAQNELNQLEQSVQQATGLSNYDTLAQTLISKRREVARQDAQLRDDYSVRRNEEIAKLQNLVLEQIVGLAKEQNFDVILNDTGVIYVSENADLTQLVIDRLNKLATQSSQTQPQDTKANLTKTP